MEMNGSILGVVLLSLAMTYAQPPPECDMYRMLGGESPDSYQDTEKITKRFVTDMNCYERPILSGDFYCFYSNLSSIPVLPMRTKCIILTGNQIPVLDSNAIEHLVNLEILVLDSNPVTAVQGDFTSIPLKVLSLEETRLPGLPAITLPNLRYYSQTNSIFGILSSESVTGMSLKLRFLRLSGTGITGTANATFSRLDCLEVLDLTNNSFTRIPIGLPGSLQRLDLLRNRYVSTIQTQSFPPLPHLQNLSVTAKSIGSHAFKNMPTIQQLKVEACHVSSNATVGLSQVNAFIVFGSFCEDKKLHLEQNAFSGLSSLSTFTMDRIPIAVLPTGLFTRAEHLETLLIEFDNIDEVQSCAFEGIPNISTLRLTNNYLPVQQPVKIANDFLGTDIKKKLSLFDLSDFRISHLTPGAFDSAPNLVRLYTGYNLMTTLSPGVIENLNSLQYFSIYGNPWMCDCHLRWLKNLTDVRPDIFYELEMTTCDQPANLHGKYFTKLSVTDFVCYSD